MSGRGNKGKKTGDKGKSGPMITNEHRRLVKIPGKYSKELFDLGLFDPERFPSREIQFACEVTYRKGGPWPERGMQYHPSMPDHLKQCLEDGRFGKLFRTPDNNCCVQGVKEFLVTGKLTYQGNEGFVKVRGKKVSFGKNLWASYFGIERQRPCEYVALASNMSEEFLTQVLEVICRGVPNANWKLPDVDFGDRKLNKCMLCKEAKWWWHLIKRMIQPSKAFTWLSSYDCVLIYCFMTNRRVDIVSLQYVHLEASFVQPSLLIIWPHFISFLLCKYEVLKVNECQDPAPPMGKWGLLSGGEDAEGGVQPEEEGDDGEMPMETESVQPQGVSRRRPRAPDIESLAGQFGEMMQLLEGNQQALQRLERGHERESRANQRFRLSMMQRVEMQEEAIRAYAEGRDCPMFPPIPDPSFWYHDDGEGTSGS